VKVRINDRGPNTKGRIVDLSAAAASALGIHGDGVMTVRVEVFASDQTP
jgi:rare lipoprotein A